MNKSGQMWAYSLMLGLVIILLGIYLAPAGQSFVNSAMNSTAGDTLGLDCDNESISNFDKAACTVTDFSSFYFFGSIILLGGAIIAAKVIFL